MNFERKFLVEQALEELRHQKKLTDIEKDILSTWNVYTEYPFDRITAEQKIVENNRKYTDIYAAICCSEGVCLKSFQQVSEAEVKQNLFMQIEAMCFKDGIYWHK